MKANRPVNLDIRTIRLPITAYSSILHRISGVILFFAVGFMLYALQQSVESQESFDAMKELFSHPVSKFITWGILTGLFYHMVAGVRHLLMDVGLGEELESGALGAKVVLVVGVAGAIIFGVLVW